MAVSFVICWKTGATESGIRITGLVLQVLGILTIFWIIYEVRRYLNYPSIKTVVVDWFRRVILRERKRVEAGHEIPIVFELGADEYFIHGAGKDLSTEERLDALKRNVDAIHERITKIGKETEKRIFQLEDLVREEKRTRQSETKKIHEKIETTGTSALPISAIGAIWLVCGVTLSTLSAEISCYIR